MLNQKSVYILSGVLIAFAGIGLAIFSMSSANADDIFVPFVTQGEVQVESAKVDNVKPTRKVIAIEKPEPLAPPPTMSPAPNQDELDREREERQNLPISDAVPTATPDPRNPPIAPPQIPTDNIVEFPTRVAKPPVSEISRYFDPNLGFTLEYPANWTIEAPSSSGLDLSRGYFVTLSNYDTSQITKSTHGLKEDEVNIQIYSSPYASGSSTEDIEKWLASRFHPDTKFTFIRQNERKDFKEWRWLISGGPFNFNMAASTIVKGERIFLISLNPADSKFSSVQEEIVESFNAP